MQREGRMQLLVFVVLPASKAAPAPLIQAKVDFSEIKDSSLRFATSASSDSISCDLGDFRFCNCRLHQDTQPKERREEPQSSQNSLQHAHAATHLAMKRTRFSYWMVTITFVFDRLY